ncbi:MAG: AgmX/PglI C-terminal domain-containing protein [Myxococcota bacterium]
MNDANPNLEAFDDYLWCPGGSPDPEVAAMEQRLAIFSVRAADDAPPVPVPTLEPWTPQPRRAPAWAAPVAAGFAVALGLTAYLSRPPDPDAADGHATAAIAPTDLTQDLTQDLTKDLTQDLTKDLTPALPPIDVAAPEASTPEGAAPPEADPAAALPALTDPDPDVDPDPDPDPDPAATVEPRPRSNPRLHPHKRDGKGDGKASLAPEAIRKVVRSHVQDVRRCYNQGLARRPTLAGRVAVRFVIGPDGAVRSAELSGSSLGDDKVEQCIVRATRTWTFPKPTGKGTVTVTYPFVLSPGSG